MRAITILVGLMMLTWPALAADHYVAPRGATVACPATGSKACPWASIGAAFASGKVSGGDTILLMDGDHGGVSAKRWVFDTVVTLQSANKNNARISNITFSSGSKNIRLRNLRVWRDEGDAVTGFLIRAYSDTSNLTLENLDIRSHEDSVNYLKWDAARWVAVATRAVDLRGSFNTVRNNRITGVAEGVIVGTDSLVEGNVIDGFAGDGMKGASRSTFRNNVVKNSVAVLKGYHRDGFQSHSSGNPIVGLTLEGNTIIQWTHDPKHPLTAALQGIGMFDGWYDNLVVQNNLVVTNHYHGISIYGTRGARIVNNTVVSLSGNTGTYPYIKVTSKKDGSPSQDVVVANNLAMQIQVLASIARNVVVTNNSAIVSPILSFQDARKFDYRPKESSGWLDSGAAKVAPKTDILGLPRPSGPAPDRGAYEVQVDPQEPAVSPTAKPGEVAKKEAASSAPRTELKPSPVQPSPQTQTRAELGKLSSITTPAAKAPKVLRTSEVMLLLFGLTK